MKGTSVNTTPFWKQISIKFCIYLTGFEGFTGPISCFYRNSILGAKKRTGLVDVSVLPSRKSTVPQISLPWNAPQRSASTFYTTCICFRSLPHNPWRGFTLIYLRLWTLRSPLQKNVLLVYFFPEQYPAKRSTLFVVRSSKVKGGNGISLNTRQQSVLGNLTMKTIGPY